MQTDNLPDSTEASEPQDAGDMSAGDLELKAKELMAEPGDLDGTLKNMNPAKYERLQGEITGLFQKVETRQGQEQAEHAEQAQAQQQAYREAEQAAIVQEAKAEMALLNELGFDDDIPPDITVGEVKALRMERLVRQGNYNEFLPLIKSEVVRLGGTPYPQPVIDMFLAMDDETRLQHALVEIQKVMEAGREQSRTEKQWRNLGETE